MKAFEKLLKKSVGTYFKEAGLNRSDGRYVSSYCELISPSVTEDVHDHLWGADPRRSRHSPHTTDESYLH